MHLLEWNTVYVNNNSLISSENKLNFVEINNVADRL